MKIGSKTALRVLDTEEEANNYISLHGGDYIEKRPGLDKKCMDYCSVCNFCNYYKENVEGKNA